MGFGFGFGLEDGYAEDGCGIEDGAEDYDFAGLHVFAPVDSVAGLMISRSSGVISAGKVGRGGMSFTKK